MRVLRGTFWGKWFLWNFPPCSFRIRLSLELVERTWDEVLGNLPDGAEAGGLLLGKIGEDEVEVSDFIPFSGAAANPPYRICSEHLDRALETCTSTARQVVGYFRTHLDQRIQLREDDLECIRRSFTDPKHVFLVIRMRESRASAAFFFWQEGEVFGQSALTFPFSALQLSQPYWASLLGGPKARRRRLGVTRAWSQLKRLAKPDRFVWITALAVVAFVSAAAVLPRFSGGLARNATSSLGLHASRDGAAVLATWNTSNPAIARAKDSDLLIWDGGSPPRFVRLTPEQLRSGRATLQAGGDKVEIRLDVIDGSENARTETVAAAGPSPKTQALSASRGAAVDPPAQRVPVAPKPVETSSSTPPPASVPGESTEPEPLSERRAVLPPYLRSQLHGDNTVAVRVQVNSFGSVTSAAAISKSGNLAYRIQGYAVNAARRWRFRPATQDGKPVAGTKTVTFLFRPTD